MSTLPGVEEALKKATNFPKVDTIPTAANNSDKADLKTTSKFLSELSLPSRELHRYAPRNYDQISSTWRTLEWHQSEVGIAYGINKPLLVFKENTVKLEGLPKYITSFENIPLIEFNRNYPDSIIDYVDRYMPYFRQAITERRVDEFFSNLIKAGIFGLAALKAGELLMNAFDGFVSEST